MPDGTLPKPGGWNRFQLEVADLAATVETLRQAGVRLRNEIVVGVGGDQILVEDPSATPLSCSSPRGLKLASPTNDRRARRGAD
jgi:hypothetical protein